MNYPIIPSSPFINQRARKYPFDNLEIGQSFTVSINEISSNTIRIAASLAGKRLKRKFKVRVDHDLNLYEIARIE